MIKVTTLIENKLGKNQKLSTEKGLSFYIEFDNKKILFDTGEEGAVVDNAKILNIDLNKLDYIVLSHGHHDHTGGLKRIMETTNNSFKLIANEKLLNLKQARMENGSIRELEDDINLEVLSKNNIQYKFLKVKIYKIDEQIYSVSNFKYQTTFEKKNEKYLLKKDNAYVIDDFQDEQSLVIDTPKGLVVFVGCSHPGIINILMGIKEQLNKNIYAVLGGSHLYAASKDKLDYIVEYLKGEKIQIIGLGHCTGTKSEEYIKDKFKKQYVSIRVGSVLVI